ncbi:DJ-1/PfpI family protein [Pendulispora brunnea]|uniref:DJ-1/PfpI family protein n=1 Tax=Pendulispora brunnea TaxID=2905690 RepID=A0ABZ2KFH9_9BACT
MERWNTGIVVFDDVEVLDFTGPFEVFSRTRLVGGVASRRSEEHAPFRVFTIGVREGTVSAIGGLKVTPDYSLANAPPIDLLLVPGGLGTRPLVNDAKTIDFIRERASSAKIVASVCTGALLLAKAGLLRGKRATTHWAALDELAKLDPEVHVERNARWVDEGAIITSAGVASGIDMSFYLVEKQHGREVADETAHYIEYRRAASA